MNTLTENLNLEIDGNFYTKEDVLNLYRIQKQLLVEENLVASLKECANIWSNYSNDLAASWLFLPKNDEDILNEVRSSSLFTNFNDYAQ